MQSSTLIIPSTFCFNKNNFKAFVLGADPTNFSDQRKAVELRTVFGIGSGDARYFRDILENLKQIGLGLDDVYVQNLIPVPLQDETAKNKHWEHFADMYLPERIVEFNKVDKTKKIPVLVTAERILDFLVPDSSEPEYYYKNPNVVPLRINKLGRPVVPFFRHKKYGLLNWKQYKIKLSDLLI